MIRPNIQLDALSELPPTPSTLLSPSTIANRVLRDSEDQSPSPGRSYVIKKKRTDRAITLTSGGLRLQDTKHGHDASNRWLCVEKGTYFGFYNERSGIFIGHDGKGNMRATAQALWDWELLSPKHHHEGGYELQSPHWFYWKRTVNDAEDGTRLRRTEYGHSLWVFEECERRE